MSEMNLKTKPVNDNWTPPPLNMENVDAVVKWWSLTHVFLEWNEEENRWIL